MRKVNPREIIEASRELARKSRDLLAAALEENLKPVRIPEATKRAAINVDLKIRMDLVMDCFNTGAAVMLKLLHGDPAEEPWEDEYDHRARLYALLSKYGLLAESATLDPSSRDLTRPE